MGSMTLTLHQKMSRLNAKINYCHDKQLYKVNCHIRLKLSQKCDRHHNMNWHIFFFNVTDNGVPCADRHSGRLWYDWC